MIRKFLCLFGFHKWSNWSGPMKQYVNDIEGVYVKSCIHCYRRKKSKFPYMSYDKYRGERDFD